MLCALPKNRVRSVRECIEIGQPDGVAVAVDDKEVTPRKLSEALSDGFGEEMELIGHRELHGCRVQPENRNAFTKSHLSYNNRARNRFLYGKFMNEVISMDQIRAARALLRWSQADLAHASGISEISIKNFERGASAPKTSTLAALREAIESEGIVFVRGGAINSKVYL